MKKKCDVNKSEEETNVNDSYNSDSDVCFVSETVSCNFFFPIDRQWQETKCIELNINFENPLTCMNFPVKSLLAEPLGIKPIVGDGNCWFRSISYIITGSEEHHTIVRKKLVHFMRSEPMCKRIRNAFPPDDIKHDMDRNGVWATDIEIFATAEMLDTDIFIYSKISNDKKIWQTFSKTFISKEGNTEADDFNKSVYITNESGVHFEVVLSVKK
ncbi:uncharacterized protein LOC120354851 [Nilaparvata lugens]|uniref:uncharacterized protein LOC120354851 n=1 Tax=Nilaparvata lugens TaxID=108931 RepID=UPI00193E1283|nr:uncharacterized protein LOC120354851 [Nilaparvata lugens]